MNTVTEVIAESNKYIDNTESAMPNLEELDQAFLDGLLAKAKATQAVALAIVALTDIIERKSS